MHIFNPSGSIDSAEGAPSTRRSLLTATPATFDALDESFRGRCSGEVVRVVSGTAAFVGAPVVDDGRPDMFSTG